MFSLKFSMECFKIFYFSMFLFIIIYNYFNVYFILKQTIIKCTKRKLSVNYYSITKINNSCFNEFSINIPLIGNKYTYMIIFIIYLRRNAN